MTGQPAAEWLADVHAAAFTKPRPWSAAEFAALLAAPEVVLVRQGDGFALGRVILDEAELLTIAVHPAARRKGLGRALLADLTQMLRTRGAMRLFLEVAADNQAALQLYHSAGFGEIGRRRGYYGTGSARTDAVILALDLA